MICYFKGQNRPRNTVRMGRNGGVSGKEHESNTRNRRTEENVQKTMLRSIYTYIYIYRHRLVLRWKRGDIFFATAPRSHSLVDDNVLLVQRRKQSRVGAKSENITKAKQAEELQSNRIESVLTRSVGWLWAETTEQ